MNRLIRFSLEHRTAVLWITGLVCAAGVYLTMRLNIDVLPDLDRPGVSVMTHVPGLSPEETEERLTDPIEEALRGTPGLAAVWSASSIGLSHVHAVFDWDADPKEAREVVARRIADVTARLPPGAKPVLLPFVSVMGEVELIGLSGGGLSPAELRRQADGVLRPRLLAIPGVAQVLVIGGDVDEVGVRVDPAKLAAAGVSLADVRRAVAAVGSVGIGGILPYDNQEYLIRVLAMASGLDDVAAAVVKPRVRVRDVARVEQDPILKRGIAGIDGGPGVILSVYKAPGEDTRRISREVGAALASLAPDLPKGLRVDRLFRQADFIDAAVGNVTSALREGALLVILVLLLFLASWRSSAVTLTALPVSLLVTVVVLREAGLSLNTLTLGGLAVAVGQLVDDAIVDVENVWRRLRENRAVAQPRPSLEVVFSASREVRGSIIYATLVVVLAVVPIALLSGVEGRLFRPLVVAYVVSVLASLVVSLTLTPALCLLLLGRVERPPGDTRLVVWLKAAERRLLAWALPRPMTVLGVAAGLCAVAALALRSAGREFLPPFNEGTLTVNVQAVPGITLEDSDKLGSLAERLLLEVPEVVRTGRRTGRAELDTHAAGIHYSEIEVALRDGRPRAEIVADIRRRLAALPGTVAYLGQPISHRLEHVLEGMNGQIILRIFGQDLGQLRDAAEKVRQAMAGVPGVADLQVEKQLLIPELQIHVDRERAASLGLNAGDVAQQAQEALYGSVVGSIPVGGTKEDVRVRLEDSAQRSPSVIAALPIALPGGGSVALDRLATVREAAGQDYLNHDDGRRFIAVTANAQGRDVAEVAEDVQRAVAKVALPSGFSISYGGAWTAEQRARHAILVFSGLALVLVALALLWHFRSIALTLQTLVNVPLAAIGSAAALWLTHGKLSAATLVGFITVCGIASRNTILLLSHYLHLVEDEGETFGEALVVRGSLERLPPMLMTALTAGLAVIPLLVSRDAPGKEILGPIAIVIAGGLVSSTLLDLIVTPAVFLRFGGGAARRTPSTARHVPVTLVNSDQSAVNL
ncbi:MAG TPA: efflux RND transporter permease subunit [Myxococcales bacterium]|nr:efflux RND transporter permease subunit [Myxococcales bacterium]